MACAPTGKPALAATLWGGFQTLMGSEGEFDDVG